MPHKWYFVVLGWHPPLKERELVRKHFHCGGLVYLSGVRIRVLVRLRSSLYLSCAGIGAWAEVLVKYSRACNVRQIVGGAGAYQDWNVSECAVLVRPLQ